MSIEGQQLSVAVCDRIVASIFCAGAVAFSVGAKSATLVLVALSIATVFGSSWRRGEAMSLLRDMTKLSPIVIASIVFSAFAALSALWADDPKLAILAGLSFLAALAIGQVLHASIKSMSPVVSVLVSGWFVFGVLIGSVVLMFELNNDYRIYRWLVTQFPDLLKANNMMLMRVDGHWVVNRSIGNWSVAAVNMMLWPVLLILTTDLRGRVKFVASLVSFALVAGVTYSSDHQTSQVALVASTFVFALAVFSAKWVRGLMLAGIVLMTLTVVPVSQHVGNQFAVNGTEWAPVTLQERFRIWGNVSARISDAPIVGIGADNSTTADTNNEIVPDGGRAPPRHPHNMLLQTWLELGALGVAILLGMVLLLFRSIRELENLSQAFALATLATIVTEAAATWNLWSSWFLAGLMIISAIFSLSLRIRRLDAGGEKIAFFEIWLPKRLFWRRYSRA